jgi:HSP20 family protein
MPYRRWDPFQDLIALHQELLSDNVGTGLQETSKPSWAPAVDIFETDKNYIIKAEVSGVDPSDIKLEYKENKLTLKGYRPGGGSDQTRQYYRIERTHGHFQRSFFLPSGLCCDEIEADYEDGVLQIMVPKDNEDKSKTIDVKPCD